MTIIGFCRAAAVAALPTATHRRFVAMFGATLASITAMGLVAAPSAKAEPFLLTISGNFYTAPSVACFVPGFASSCTTQPASIAHIVGGATVSSMNIPDGTPFTETARFDTASPNLAAGLFPGTAFYSPSAATLAVGGVTYQIAPYSNTVPFGAAVAIFDKTSPFPAVPEYGVALIGNVLKQGSGILADFTSASPEFGVGHLISTTFPGSSYVGTGIFSGSCASNCAIPSPPNQVDNVEPIPLTLNGQSYALSLPDNVLLNYYLALNDPNTGNGFGTTITTPFTASLTDVPEPASGLLLALCLMGLTFVRSIRRLLKDLRYDSFFLIAFRNLSGIGGSMGLYVRLPSKGGGSAGLLRSLSRTSGYLLLALACGSIAARAQSSWSEWQPLPLPPQGTASDIAVARDASGHITVAVVGRDGALWQTSEDVVTGGWIAWTRIAPPAGVARIEAAQSGKIALRSNADGRLQEFVGGSDGRLWSRWQVATGGWGTWVPFYNPAPKWSLEDITADNNADGTIELFVKSGYDTQVYRTHQTAPDGGWAGNWQLVDGPEPSKQFTRGWATSLDHSGRLELATVGADNGSWVRRQTLPGGVFEPWSQTAAPAGGLNTVSALLPNQDARLEMIALSDGKAWHTWQNAEGRWGGTGWADYGAPPNGLFGAPFALRLGNGHLAVIAWDRFGALLSTEQESLSGGWASWSLIRNDLFVTQDAGYPKLSGTLSGDGRAEIFTVGRNGLIYRVSEINPPEVPAPAPGSSLAPARILDVRATNSMGPYINPTCDPSNSSCDTSSTDWTKKVCDGGTWLSGPNPQYEWTSVLDKSEKAEKRSVGALGWAFQNAPPGEDVWFTHPFGNDYTLQLSLDSPYVGLVGGQGDDGSVKAREEAAYYGHNADHLIHVEMDSDFIPVSMRARGGDRVALIGRWIVDCGHDNYQTEIHPPLLFATARPVDASTTDATIVGRPFLVTQEFGDGALFSHLLKQLARAFAGPVPTIAQLDARPEVLTIPFSGKQQFDLVFSPPIDHPGPGQSLYVRYWLNTRPGVTATFFEPEPGSLGLHVVFDSQKYTRATPPPKRNINISEASLKNENHSLDEYLPIFQSIIPFIVELNPFGNIVVSKGVDTDRYQMPIPIHLPLAQVRASSLFGKQARSSASSPWPIMGEIIVAWQADPLLTQNHR